VDEIYQPGRRLGLLAVRFPLAQSQIAINRSPLFRLRKFKSGRCAFLLLLL